MRDPYTQGNTQKVEIQRWSARFYTSRHRNISSVSDMLQCLNWWSLQDRWKDAHLCMLYRIHRELVAIRRDRRLVPPRRRTKKDHSTCSTFQTISCRTDTRKMSFFPWTVRDWNALPPDITEVAHSVPSRPGCQPCKELEDVLLLTCQYEDFNNPHNQIKLYLDLATSMEELFLVNPLPSPSIIFNKLKESSKRQK